jgi:cytochrome c peroxidase
MMSCATCHQQSRAFTDGRPRAVGSAGALHARSAMSLSNVAYNASYGWADPNAVTLEAQMAMPLFNEHPIELGVKGREDAIAARLAADPAIAAMFADAFPGERPPVRMDTIVRAIASFERTLISGATPFDRYLYADDRAALGAAGERGMRLFFSERVGCAECHGGFNLSGPTVHEGGMITAPAFHNTGLYDVDGRGSYPALDRGLIDITRQPGDMGRFRAPTLRNIALTAPYMHDGSLPTLDRVIDHYAAGGHASPFRDARMRSVRLSPGERRDLVAFLESLSDQAFVTDPAFAPPRPPR